MSAARVSLGAFTIYFLRLGTFELGWLPDVPTAVAITEAVELAKQYSTENSGRFVNGLLARIAEQVRAPA